MSWGWYHAKGLELMARVMESQSRAVGKKCRGQVCILEIKTFVSSYSS